MNKCEGCKHEKFADYGSDACQVCVYYHNRHLTDNYEPVEKAPKLPEKINLTLPNHNDFGFHIIGLCNKVDEIIDYLKQVADERKS